MINVAWCFLIYTPVVALINCGLWVQLERLAYITLHYLWFRRFIAGKSLLRLGFYPRPVHAGFVVDKVKLGEGLPLGLCLFEICLGFFKFR